jgi:hypothetical protein
MCKLIQEVILEFIYIKMLLVEVDLHGLKKFSTNAESNPLAENQ